MHWAETALRALLLALVFGCGIIVQLGSAWATNKSGSTPTEKSGKCEELFPGAGDNGEICKHLKLIPDVDRVAHDQEIDHLIVESKRDGESNLVDAKYIKQLIQEAEALNRDRFFELRFNDVKVCGTLHLDEIYTRYVWYSKVAHLFVQLQALSLSERLKAKARVFLATPTRVRWKKEVKTTKNPPWSRSFSGASLVISNSRFRERIVFKNTQFEGHLFLSGNQFDQGLEIAGGDIFGDLVLEDVDFANNLRLGEGTTIHGQVVVNNMRVGGDFDFDSMAFEAPKRWSPLPDEVLKHAGKKIHKEKDWENDAVYLKSVRDLSSYCVCVKQDGKPRLDQKKIDKESSRIEEVRTVCQSLAVLNLPRCATSGGSTLPLIQMNDVNVVGSFSVANEDLDLKTPSKTGSEGDSDSSSRSIPEGITLYNVNVRGTGSLSYNKTSQIYLNHSQFERLQSVNNTYGKFIASRNELGSFISLRDTFNGSVTITQNGFTRSFGIDSGIFPSPDEEKTSCEDQNSAAQSASGVTPKAEESESVIALPNNVVGRDLTFTPFQMSRCFKSIDLSSNRVGGVLSVNLPITPHNSLIKKGEDPEEYKLDWHGKVQLRSVDVGSSLELGLAYADIQNHRAISNVKLDDGSFFQVGNDRKAFKCEEDAVYIELDHTKTIDFVWALPISHKSPTCFRWEGVGFRYANWVHPKNSSENDPIEDLEQWGKLYNKDGSTKEGVSSKPSDPLHYMADYLDQNGHRRDSRNMLAEAKAADFPFWEPWSECWGGKDKLPNCDSAMRNAIARFIFFPTNFGTSPQKALGILFIATLVFYGVYSFNKWFWQRQGRWAR